MKKIYLDCSATTPVDPVVYKIMQPYFSYKYGNPSSLHNFGQEAATAVFLARENIAKFLNCLPEEIIFTSGATESNNLAIFGVIKAIKKSIKNRLHIITSSIEHPAVLEPFKYLENCGFEVTYLPVTKKGIVKIESLKNYIKENTVFLSIMYVNSEIGTIQPIREIGKIIKKMNIKRENRKSPPIYFHCDAVQAINFLNCDVKYLGVDLLSFSGHKIYGPKGVGALYIKKGVPIRSVQLGGHQEDNLRSGTLNVCGIVGLGAAVKLVNQYQKINNKKISRLRNKLINGIIKYIPEVTLNSDLEFTAPSHAHFSFKGVEGESILIALDLAGIAVSTGSACASGSLKTSHVLSAMGLSEEQAHNSIRFTIGKNATEAEINRVIKILPLIIKKLRHIAPKD